MNLQIITNQIREYEKKYHREINSVRLIAVSKKQPVEKILEAIESGQDEFGESYVQEAIPKIEFCRKNTKIPIIWHFIGPIQSNKTKQIAEYFDWVHSIDRIKIAERLNDQRPAHLPPLNVCVQINIDQEKTKSGVLIEEVETIAKEIIKLPKLKLRGLMAIPEPTADIEKQRKNFKLLKDCFNNLNQKGFQLDTLSMGMTDDFESAIAEGATYVRIGTAIFGSRI